MPYVLLGKITKNTWNCNAVCALREDNKEHLELQCLEIIIIIITIIILCPLG